MNFSDSKIQKLIEVAKLYYEDDKNQNEIAELYQISRPLVSRMLKEAKEAGIVHIEVRSSIDGKGALIGRIKTMFNLEGAYTVPTGVNDNATNVMLAEGALNYLKGLKGKNLGIGWGTIIGVLVSVMEQRASQEELFKWVCPLVGNGFVSNRNYHSNENVRIIAQQTGAKPCYLYSPAFAETTQDLELIKKLESYKAIFELWKKMDIALLNIGNYPSVPDFASGARYGNLLNEKKATGRVLAYYYNLKGELIKSDMDYAIQIPLELLRGCKNVVGFCSANVNPSAIVGALRTGLFHHVIASEELMKACLEFDK